MSDRFTRIEKVLDYIHENLDASIQVAELAEKSCWSRWQFQRVFGEATGLTVAQYIRELRLSKAAEMLLSSRHRHVEIALQCGFESEISFSRAFKHMFQSSPREYKQRGKRQGLKTPLQYRQLKTTHHPDSKAYTQIRIENHDAFQIKGKHDWIRGPLSAQPDFLERVPKLWQTLDNEVKTQLTKHQPIGVIDTRHHHQHPDQLCYWAGYVEEGIDSDKLEEIDIPAQEYAVIPVHGSASAVEQAVTWFIYQWLPESNYQGICGYELECYEAHYDAKSPNSYMEYWLPIKPR